jgi:uracil-DNA glycosylase family 4
VDNSKHGLIVAAAAKGEYTFAMPFDDPREELASIAASLRAYLEWQVDTGAGGIPRKPRGAAPRAAAPEERATKPLSVEAPATLEARVTKPLSVEAPAPVAAPAAPPRALDVIREEVASCTKCTLAPTRKNTVFSRGNPQAKLVFVGEAPGADEDAQGLPFVGVAGQLLDRMIKAMGLDPETDVYICNIIKCRPPGNRKPTPEEMDTCMPYLHEQLANLDPKVIVATGNTAVAGLLGTKIGITKLRGSWKLYRGKIPVMPTFHPSYLLRESATQAEAKRQVWEDLQTVMKELGLEKKPR